MSNYRLIVVDNQFILETIIGALGIHVWYPTPPTRTQIRDQQKALRKARLNPFMFSYTYCTKQRRFIK
jgi:hypothetical protein